MYSIISSKINTVKRNVAIFRRFSYFLLGFRRANRLRGLRSATFPLRLLTAIKGLGLGFCNRLYLGFIATAKGRAKIIRELSHFKALDPQFMRSIIPSQHDAGSVAKLIRIRSKGARPSCWFISQNSDLAGKEADLLLARTVSIGYQMGTIISCIPGNLGYFEDEDGRCLLER